jgi:hypothetical protein
MDDDVWTIIIMVVVVVWFIGTGDFTIPDDSNW